MTIHDHEREVLRASRSEVLLTKTPYGFLHMLGDKRAEALVAERRDLDINCHYGMVQMMNLLPGMTCLDIGAYIGDSTIALLRAGCKVMAFEPFLDAFLCLLFNTLHYQDMISCYHLAIGNRETVNLDYSYQEADCGCRYVKHEATGIQTVRVDDVVQGRKVDFIKIDVEGHELHVLRGAAQTIAKHRPKLFVESFPDGLARQRATPKDLHDLIMGLGYDLFDRDMNPATRTDYTSMMDLVCIPK